MIYSQFIEKVPSYSTFDEALAVAVMVIAMVLPEYSRLMSFLFSFGILKVKLRFLNVLW